MANFAVAPADPQDSPTATSSRLHFLDGEPMLFDEVRQKLYALDRTAAFIWCCLEDGLGIDGTATRLAEATSLSLAAGRALVADAVQRWRERGLLDSAGDVATVETVDKPTRTQVAVLALRRPPTRAAVITERRVNLAGMDLHLSCTEPEVAQRVLPLFAHLPPPADVAPLVRIDIRSAPGGYAVFQDRVPVLRIGELAGVAPALKAHLVQTILARPDYRLAVHAAAVAKGGRVLLLPGDSGSGKTTLAAALIARGFAFLGDDTVVLERGDLRVRPIPFALAVKAGAWDLLTPYHPRLPELPVDCRPDGKVVRYLRPTDVAAEALPAAWMVFPGWGNGSAPRLTRLARVAALQRFLPGCYASAHCLKSAELGQLVQWIETIDCYTLDSSDLGAAVGLLDQLCR